MFKKTKSPELTLFESPSNLMRGRALKKYDAPEAWHNQFYELVTSNIDEDKFKKASAGTMKSLFTGSGSYTSVVENKASLIASLAESQASKYSGYNAKGSYDAGASLSSFFTSGV